MKQGFKRTVLLVLCVVTALSAVPVNASDAGARAPVLAGSRQGALTAVEDCRPDPDYMAWSDTGDPIELPRSRDYLSKPFVAKANGVKKKVSIYLMPQPESGHGNLGTVAHGEKVLVLAKRNGFYFFMTEDGRYGWNGTPPQHLRFLRHPPRLRLELRRDLQGRPGGLRGDLWQVRAERQHRRRRRADRVDRAGEEEGPGAADQPLHPGPDLL